MTNIHKYLLCLYREYCNATGVKFDSNSLPSKEFYLWLSNYQQLLKSYKEHLYCLGLEPDEYFECDKGVLNSIATPERRITEFCNTPSRLCVFGNFSKIITETDCSLIAPKHHFLTFNAESFSRFYDFAFLHNNGNKIVLSVIGNTADEDIFTKIDMLDDTSQYLSSNFKKEFDTDSGNYFYTIFSKDKINVLTKKYNSFSRSRVR